MATVSNVAGLVRPLALHDLEGTVSATFGERPKYTFNGASTLRNGETDAVVANAVFDVQLTTDEAGLFQPTADVAFENLHVTNVDHLFGDDEPTLSQWVGDTGSVRVVASPTADGFDATLTSELPYLAGAFHVIADAESIVLSPPDDALTWTLQAGALERMLNKPSAIDDSENTGATEVPHRDAIAVRHNVPLELTVRSFALPRAVLSGAPVERDTTAIDITLTASRPPTLRRTVEGETEATPIDAVFRRFSVNVKANSLRQLTYELTGGAENV